jgi:hypothetical protein
MRSPLTAPPTMPDALAIVAGAAGEKLLASARDVVCRRSLIPTPAWRVEGLHSVIVR